MGREVRHRRVRRPWHEGHGDRTPRPLIPVFDLDGTLVDSDAALLNAYVRCGVPASDVTFGHVVGDECRRLGISVDDYLAAYDPAEVVPFPGADGLVRSLDRWAVCSNKVRRFGVLELSLLGWSPDVALFADDFGGSSKSLPPVLALLGSDVTGADVVFVGDTAHDREAARAVGAVFALAGWNPRAVPEPGDVVLAQPADLLDLLAG